MIERNQLVGGRFFVGFDGGQVTCITPDGEVRWQLGFQSGSHDAGKVVEFMYPGDLLELDGSMSLIAARGQNTGRVRAQTFGPVHTKTGANPDFRPSVATEHEMRLRKIVADVNKAEQRLEKRMKAFERITAPAPSPAPVEVIENEEEPQNEPQNPPAEPQGDAAAAPAEPQAAQENVPLSGVNADG